MRTFTLPRLLLLCLSLAALTADAAERQWKAQGAAPAADRQSIQGRWRIVAMNRDGKQYGAAQIGRLAGTMRFDGDRVLQAAGDDPGQDGTFVLDPAAKPKRLTITEKREGAAPNVMIYELDGDTLRLASLRDPPDDRQADFEPGRGRVVMTLERDRE